MKLRWARIKLWLGFPSGGRVNPITARHFDVMSREEADRVTSNIVHQKFYQSQLLFREHMGISAAAVESEKVTAYGRAVGMTPGDVQLLINARRLESRHTAKQFDWADVRRDIQDVANRRDR